MIPKHLKTQASLPIATFAALLVFVTTADPAAAAPGIPRGPGIHEIANTVTLTGTSTGPVLATCPPGEVALGGGWNVPSQDRVFAAELNGNTWAVSVTGPSRLAGAAAAVESKGGTEVGAGAVTAYVECVYGVVGLLVTSQTAQFTAPANHNFTEAISCNPKEFPVGFGFNLGGPGTNIFLQDGFPLTSLVGSNGNLASWIIYGLNQDSVTHSASLSILCLASSSPPLYLQTTGGIASAVTTESVTAPCPQGTRVAGGGFHINWVDISSPGGIANPYLIHAANGGWQAGYNGVTGSVLALFVPVAHAICLGFPAPPNSPQGRPPNARPR